MDAMERMAPQGLAERAKRRDTTAFEALVRPRLPGLLRTATAIVGNEHDALDALQDALAAAWRDIAGLRDPDRFEAWLTRILVNQCRHAAGRRRRDRLGQVRLDVAGDGGSRSIEQAATDDLGRSVATRNALERAFERLSSDERAILVFHHLDGRPLREIAALLEIPEGTAKSRLSTARAALERSLQREMR